MHGSWKEANTNMRKQGGSPGFELPSPTNLASMIQALAVARRPQRLHSCLVFVAVWSKVGAKDVKVTRETRRLYCAYKQAKSGNPVVRPVNLLHNRPFNLFTSPRPGHPPAEGPSIACIAFGSPMAH